MNRISFIFLVRIPTISEAEFQLFSRLIWLTNIFVILGVIVPIFLDLTYPTAAALWLYWPPWAVSPLFLMMISSKYLCYWSSASRSTASLVMKNWSFQSFHLLRSLSDLICRYLEFMPNGRLGKTQETNPGNKTVLTSPELLKWSSSPRSPCNGIFMAFLIYLMNSLLIESASLVITVTSPCLERPLPLEYLASNVFLLYLTNSKACVRNTLVIHWIQANHLVSMSFCNAPQKMNSWF